jgi:hypothetical protein
VVQAGAAKDEVFKEFGPGSEAYHAYEGDSLGVFRPTTETSETRRDLIAEVMVAAAAGTGRFGNVPRRLLYRAPTLNRDLVRAIHALSAEAYQRVLSVKAGSRPLPYEGFKEHVLRPLEQGCSPDCATMPPDLREFVGSTGVQKACELLCGRLESSPAAWLRWLYQPGKLGELLGEGPLEIRGCVNCTRVPPTRNTSPGGLVLRSGPRP